VRFPRSPGAMSGFERSAPIPGSQGPRRSQMVRFNNAPPEMSEWRREVLEAQKEAQRQIQAAKGGGRAASRSRSPPPRRPKGREREKAREGKSGGGTNAPATASATTMVGGGGGPTSGRRPDASAVAPETGVVLRQAREQGQGWYAAVARAAESWQGVSAGKKRDAAAAAASAATGGVPMMQPESEDPLQSSRRREKDQPKSKKAGKEDREPERSRRREEEPQERKRSSREDDRDDLEEEEEQKRLQQQKMEFQAKAEERNRQLEEKRRRAEEDRRKNELQKKARQSKLKGAFAIDDDEDDDETEKRKAELARKALDRRRTPTSLAMETPLGAFAASSAASTEALAVHGQPAAGGGGGDASLGEKLRFEPGLSPAEAFMRLQERKRKGRRTEFGGPPRGCSPWRDGKRGVTVEREVEEKRQAELAGAAFAAG